MRGMPLSGIFALMHVMWLVCRYTCSRGCARTACSPFSVLRFLTQVPVPTQAVLRAEQAVVASLTRSATHSLGQGLLSALPLVGACGCWPDVAVTAPATLIREAAFAF